MKKILNDPLSKMLRGEITKIKYYLSEKNMTTQELSERSLVNKRNLDEYVSGRKDIRAISYLSGLSIARALEVDPWDLIPHIYDNTKDPNETDTINYTPILDIQLSSSLCHILKEHEIKTLEDLSGLTKDDVVRWRNIGRKSLDELTKIMEDHNLSFAK